MRLIDADALRLTHCLECMLYYTYECPENYGGECDEDVIFHIDTANTIEPTKIGSWTEKNAFKPERVELQSARCDACGAYHTTPFIYRFKEYNYCPNCGARMKGGEDEED